MELKDLIKDLQSEVSGIRESLKQPGTCFTWCKLDYPKLNRLLAKSESLRSTPSDMLMKVYLLKNHITYMHVNWFNVHNER